MELSYQYTTDTMTDTMTETIILNNANIYRYKFTEHFMAQLYVFSKIHQYDDRHSFKDAWQLWIEENDELVKTEELRILRLGYEGDVLDKMFKSGRYYFRKKSTIESEPKKRREYINVSKRLIETIDIHVTTSKRMKPSDAFDQFYKENTELVKEEIAYLCKHPLDIIEDKIKKTYKNRFFIGINK